MPPGSEARPGAGDLYRAIRRKAEVWELAPGQRAHRQVSLSRHGLPFAAPGRAQAATSPRRWGSSSASHRRDVLVIIEYLPVTLGRREARRSARRFRLEREWSPFW